MPAMRSSWLYFSTTESCFALPRVIFYYFVLFHIVFLDLTSSLMCPSLPPFWTDLVRRGFVFFCFLYFVSSPRIALPCVLVHLTLWGGDSLVGEGVSLTTFTRITGTRDLESRMSRLTIYARRHLDPRIIRLTGLFLL